MIAFLTSSYKRLWRYPADAWCGLYSLGQHTPQPAINGPRGFLFLVVMPYVAAPLFLALDAASKGNATSPSHFTQKEDPPNSGALRLTDFQNFGAAPRARRRSGSTCH